MFCETIALRCLSGDQQQREETFLLVGLAKANAAKSQCSAQCFAMKTLRRKKNLQKQNIISIFL
jgi:hypothetical protein